MLPMNLSAYLTLVYYCRLEISRCCNIQTFTAASGDVPVPVYQCNWFCLKTEKFYIYNYSFQKNNIHVYFDLSFCSLFYDALNMNTYSSDFKGFFIIFLKSR